MMLKILMIPIFCSIAFVGVIAQHELYSDSIAQLISNTPSDSLLASIYYDAARHTIMNLGDLKLNRKYNDSSMHYSIKSGHQDLEAKSHFAFGLLERLEGNYEKALEHLSINIEYFKEDSVMVPYAMLNKAPNVATTT